MRDLTDEERKKLAEVMHSTRFIKFGKVFEQYGKGPRVQAFCACGGVSTPSINAIKTLGSRSCGCLRKTAVRGTAFLNKDQIAAIKKKLLAKESVDDIAREFNTNDIAISLIRWGKINE